MTHRLTRELLLAATLLLLATLAPTTGAGAAEVYPGAQYREEYVPMGDAPSVGPAGVNLGGTVLHADVLRSAEDSWSQAQPVVMVVSPYTNHNGSTTDVDPMGGEGPNARFYDFLDVTGALDEGYTFVQVDLPGNGGSSGCNDWGGPVEQGAVAAAVEWAARQPWSNGKVALLGKSYDGWTGLMGMAQDQIHGVDGLAAVVSQEPVFSGYRYLYNNGVRFLNSVSTNALFQVVDAKPGALNDDLAYHLNGAPQAYCYGLNIGLQQQDDEGSAFWSARDLVDLAAGSDVPLFLTQGFLETNTKVDAALEFWEAIDHSHGHNRLWIGQFDHVRGWEQTCGWSCEGEFLMGRDDFAEQVMTFLDEHLKGIVPEVADGEEAPPTIFVQDSLGRYRAEETYPAADADALVTALNTGTYDDAPNGASIWSVSAELDHDVWISGEPVLSASVTSTVPRGNITAFVYDVAPSGVGRLVNQGTSLIRGTGAQEVTVPMYAQDWVVPEGHRLAVEIVGTGSGFASWVHVPTLQDITVTEADIAIPFLTDDRTEFLDGHQTTRLRGYSTGTTVGADVVAAAEVPFTLPAEIDTGDPEHGLPE